MANVKSRYIIEFSPKGAVFVWGLWTILPVVIVIVIAIVGSSNNKVMQEAKISFVAMAVFAGAYLLIDLLIVLVFATKLSGPMFLGIVLWACLVGWYGGPGVVYFTSRPLASVTGEASTFVVYRGLKGGAMQLRAATGPAAGSIFTIERTEWSAVYKRIGRSPAPGKVYKGAHDLWFAQLD